MAIVRPFSALRFTKAAGEIDALVCPPYDIIGEAQRQALLARSEHNIVRLELPGGDYAGAGNTLRDWCAANVLACDQTPAFYVYEIGFDGQAVAGIVARVHLEDFAAGVILPHEETLSKAKDDRWRLMNATNANFSAIYALYRDEQPLDLAALTTNVPPLYDFVDDADLHQRLWAVTDTAAVAAIAARFAQKKLYIADGHHRYETALRYRDAAPDNAARQYVMMMLAEMTHPGLAVHPTHRLVRDVPAFDAAALLRRCEEHFDLRALPLDEAQTALTRAYDEGKKAFVFYSRPSGVSPATPADTPVSADASPAAANGKTAVLLTLRDVHAMDAILPTLAPASRGLDVRVLHTLILEPLLGIDSANMAAGSNLTYTRDVQEAVAGVDSGLYQAAFLMNPTRISEICDVAAAGEKMPQKSTYFYPKLLTGLTMNVLE